MSDNNNKPLSIPTPTVKPEKPIVEKPYSEDAPSPGELNEAKKKAEALIKGEPVVPPKEAKDDEKPTPAASQQGGQAPEIPDQDIKPNKKKLNQKAVGMMFMAIFLVASIFTGVVLSQQSQELRSEASEPYPTSTPPPCN